MNLESAYNVTISHVMPLAKGLVVLHLLDSLYRSHEREIIRVTNYENHLAS